jgi:hypothetical protein
LQYNTVEKNTENIDTLNQLLQSNKYYYKNEYFNQSESQGVASYFKTLVHEKETITTKVYVKNTAGWEQYSELVDGSVTMEKLADDVKASINRVITKNDLD